MTIQIPIVLWAIISFIVLMLILNRFLYKPVLAVLDARRKRIEEAARMKAEMEPPEAEAAAQPDRAAEELAEEEHRLAYRSALEALADSEVRKRQEERLEAYRLSLSGERPLIEEGLWQQLEPLSEAIAEKLLS